MKLSTAFCFKTDDSLCVTLVLECTPAGQMRTQCIYAHLQVCNYLKSSRRWVSEYKLHSEVDLWLSPSRQLLVPANIWWSCIESEEGKKPSHKNKYEDKTSVNLQCERRRLPTLQANVGWLYAMGKWTHSYMYTTCHIHPVIPIHTTKFLSAS